MPSLLDRWDNPDLMRMLVALEALGGEQSGVIAPVWAEALGMAEWRFFRVLRSAETYGVVEVERRSVGAFTANSGRLPNHYRQLVSVAAWMEQGAATEARARKAMARRRKELRMAKRAVERPTAAGPALAVAAEAARPPAPKRRARSSFAAKMDEAELWAALGEP